MSWMGTPIFTLKQLKRSKRDRNERWMRSRCSAVYLGNDTSCAAFLGASGWRFGVLVDGRLLEIWLTKALTGVIRYEMTT
jgi:hypothetical protein